MVLFRKDMEPSCSYCRKGQQVNERQVLCLKRGIVPPEHHCRAFQYDPLKRVPPRPAALDADRLKQEDFAL